MSGQQRLLAICAFLMFSAVATLAQMTIQRQDISLNSGWEFRQLGAGDNSAGWLPAQVPGDVHLDLLRNKLIPDPFYRDNEAKLQWIENADWEYRTTIQATPDLLKHKNIELVFEGLDAYAKVYLNEQLVLTADNMFREWRVNVKPVLKPGANQLRSRLSVTDQSCRRDCGNGQVARADPHRREDLHPQSCLRVRMGLGPTLCHQRHMEAGEVGTLGCGQNLESPHRAT